MNRADVDRIVSEAHEAGVRANLRDANLWGANLSDANLWGADLSDANLWGADLRGATGAQGVALGVSGLLSGDSTLYPTRDGWRLAVGCWQGTPDALRTMIATDYGWPEATGHECARRRPSLLALLALCDDHIARHPDVVPELVTRWGVSA